MRQFPELYAQLREISYRDPDGGETEPTPAMHAAHEAWAVATYGADVWRIYTKSTWDTPEV